MSRLHERGQILFELSSSKSGNAIPPTKLLTQKHFNFNAAGSVGIRN